MRRMNTILSALPPSNLNFLSEVIPIQSKPNLIAVVRKNGKGLSSPTDIAIINLDPSQPVEITKDEIHQIACNFQKQVIPEFSGEHSNWHTGNPDYNMAYQSVMSCMDTNRIYVDSSIKTNFPNKVTSPFNIFKPVPIAKPNISKMAKRSKDDTTAIEEIPPRG